MKEQRVAIVTGGTRGMGTSISMQLAKDGNVVYAIYRSDQESAQQVEADLKEISPKSEIYQCDVSVQAETDKLVEYIARKHGRIDILVNNAGIFDFKMLEDMTEEYLDNFLAVNFKSQVFLMQACVPHMKKNNFGRIINASSISSSIADVGLIGYGCSKAAVDMLVKITAGELGPYNITVNGYAPGIIATDLTADMIEERGEMQARQVALNRFGTCDEVGALVGFLASEEAGYITGDIIAIDGGFFKVQNPYRAHEYVQEKEANKS